MRRGRRRDAARTVQGAIERLYLLFAETAARELGQLSLANALALTLLIAEQAPGRYDRAAVRWLVRYCDELPGVDVAEAFAVLAALEGLRDGRPTAERFCAVLRQQGLEVESGVFGARMHVELVNDGPVTIVLDT